MNRAVIAAGTLAAGVIAASGGVGLLLGPVNDLGAPHPTPQAQAMADVCGQEGGDSYRCFLTTQAASAASSGQPWRQDDPLVLGLIAVAGVGVLRVVYTQHRAARPAARPARRYAVAGVEPLPIQHVTAAPTEEVAA